LWRVCLGKRRRKDERNRKIARFYTRDKQQEFNYVNMAKLYYDFVDKNFDYMNFTVKLTLGIKSDGRHIQYSVNKIEVQK